MDVNSNGQAEKVRMRNITSQEPFTEVVLGDTDLLREQSNRPPQRQQQGNDGDIELMYSIKEIPPWYLCIVLGLQHFLTAFGATLSIPLLIAPAMCIADDNVAIPEILCTIIFVSGLVTLIQSTFGTRLPIIQGGTFSFLAPTFAILSLPKFECPELPDMSNVTNETILEMFEEAQTELWQIRMREVQGAIILASLFQVAIGALGIMGILLNYIGPLAIAPTIALVGLSLFGAAADNCAGQWWIAIATIVCIIIVSQFLQAVEFPTYKRVSKKSDDPESGRKSSTCVRSGTFPFFRVFPVILSICIMWFICYILTITDTLPPIPGEWGYEARTDTRLELLRKAKWFRFPYPFQWGIPTFSAAGVFGMLAGVLAGMIESVGDYYACARLAGAPPPPTHATNRGILVEGTGCVLAGMWGTGNGTTSYSENIGAIGITKVGSRVVIQTASLFMLLVGMLSKFGAFFVTIPTPIIGGVFMVTFGMIVSVGLSNLQYANMNSSRNLFIVGFSLFFGLSLPVWMSNNGESINTGSDVADQIFTVLLSTSMFVGGVVGFVLDNTIPGTDEERGIKAWRRHVAGDDEGDDSGEGEGGGVDLSCYDFPWCMGCINRVKCFRYIPFCPGFKLKFSCKSCKSREEDAESSHAHVVEGVGGTTNPSFQGNNSQSNTYL